MIGFRHISTVGGAMLAGFLATGGAMADTANQPAAADPFSDLMKQDTLLGTMGGLRPWLQQYGATLSLTETSEILGNLTGGIHRGFEYDGLTTATFQLDTAKAFGWQGGTFNVSALQIHGRNLTADNLLALQAVSSVEAERATRLWELWYEQQFAGDVLSLKLGLISADQDFMVTSNGLLFLNAALGWPASASADIPGGGPAYPLSSPGLRLRVRGGDTTTLLAGIFSGSPSNHIGEPQEQDPSGTSFPLNDGVLAIVELQYHFPPIGMERPGYEPSLTGTYRFGAWYDSRQFADLRFDTAGVSLASPASNGMPQLHQGDFGLYAIADQRIWQSPSDREQSLNLFARIEVTPQTDRNLIDVSANAGLNLRKPLPGRADDSLGIAFGIARFSGRQAALDRDVAAFGTFTPIQSSESFVELTYQYRPTPWLQIQPDFQYIFNPGGGIANPNVPTQKIKDEAVIGIRTNITF